MAQSEVFNIKAIADFSQPEKEVQRLKGRLDKEINSAFRNMEKSFGQPLGHITGRVDDFASSLEASNARVIAFGASAGIVYQVSKAFRELVRSTIQVEKSMADIQVVLNANVKQLENYRSGIFRVAKETGQSFFEVSKAATELARQGLSAEKTLIRLKDALVLSRLSGMDTLDSVEALTAAINGFGESVIDSTRLVNKFAEVDQKFAVSSQDLAEAFKRVGSTAVDAGVSIDELIALVTTAQQITARGGSVIGNSFKTIFTRVQRPQVLEDLEEAGIKVRDFSGESLKAVDILKNLANSYDTLSSAQRSFVSEAVGGVFQINVLKALLKDIDGEFSVFSRALDTSANASDAAAKKNALLNQTLDSLINKSTENLREFGVMLGELTVKPILVKTLSAVNSIVEYIISNKDELAGVFDVIGKFISGPVFGLVAGSLVRLFASFGKFALQAGAQIAGLTKRQEDVARIQNMISNILVSQPELYQRITTGAISVQQAEKVTLSILQKQAAERAKMMNFASGAASHAFASGARVDTRRKTLSVPNMADPVREAIQREVASGIPKSAIRIATDGRLKSSNNPQGLGIYNTIDEPLGISQGINRSRQMGIDPRTHGIPNFAFQKKKVYNPKTGQSETILFDPTTGQASTAAKETSKAAIYSAMRDQAKMFASEFEKVLTNPKVSKIDKENLVAGVSKALEKGHPLSVKNISAVSSPEAKQFVEQFKGRGIALSRAERSSMRAASSGAGILSFRERRSSYTVGELGGSYYAKSSRTGNTYEISEKRAEQLRRAQSNRIRRQRRGESEFAPVTVRSSMLYGPKYGTSTPSVNELLSNPQYLGSPKISPDVRTRLYNRLRSEYPPLNPNQMGPSVSSSAVYGMMKQMGSVNVTGSNALNYSGEKVQKSGFFSRNFPTFLSPFRGSTGNTGGGLFQRMRNMDPMNKMLLLGGVGGLASIGTSAFESSVAKNSSLSEIEKRNQTMLSGGVGNALTGAMIGGSLTAGTGIGMFGGAVAGGLISSLFSIKEILGNWNDITPQLEKNLRTSTEALQSFNGSFQTITSNLLQIEELGKQPDSPEKRRKIRELYSATTTAIQNPNIQTGAKKDLASVIRDSSVSAPEKARLINQIYGKSKGELESRQSFDDFVSSLNQAGKSGDKTFSIQSFLNVIRGDKTIADRLSSMSREDAVALQSSLNTALKYRSGSKDLMSSSIRLQSSGNKPFSLVGAASESDIASIPNLSTNAFISPSGIDTSSINKQIVNSSLKDVLKTFGFEEASKEFKQLYDILSKYPDLLKTFSLELIKSAGSYNGLTKAVENSITTTENLFLKRRRELTARRVGLSEDRISILQSKIPQRLNESSFLESRASAGLSFSPMNSLQKLMSENSIRANFARSNLPFRTQMINNQLASGIIGTREGLTSSLSQDSSSLEIEAAKTADTLLESIQRKLEYGDFDLAFKELANGIDVVSQKAGEAGGQLYDKLLKNLTDLNLEFNNASIQTDELNRSIERTVELQKQEERLLRRKYQSPFATSEFLKSESIRVNAQRRALDGSDPRTEITSSMRAFREEMGYTVNDFYTDFENSARDAAQTFKSEFKSAFTEFRRGALDAGEALRQFAINVLDRIATNASNMAIDSLLSSAFGGASRIFSNVQMSRTGGMIRKRYASGGSVTGGSGVVDDVPAMLTSGEYVINRDAVRTYGSDFFRSINQKRGAVGRLENQYLFLDDKGNVSATPTQGQARISSSLSNIGATNDLMRANTDRFAREQRFVSYVQAKRQYDFQRSQAIKQYERGIRQQAIGAGVSAGIGIGGGMLGSYMDSRNFVNDAISSYQFPQSAPSASYGPALPPSQGVMGFRNSGGVIPRAGSSNRDTMGYSLTGGEGIVRKEAVNMYGPQLINDLNNGRAKTMRFGGSESTSPIAEIRNLPSAMDRLSNAIQNLQNRTSESSSGTKGVDSAITNQFSFNIEVNASGGEMVATTTENTQENNTQTTEDNYRQIGEVTKMVALQAIQDNLREGGMIYNAIRRR